MFWYKGETYAKVWKIDKKEKYAELQISTSEKDRQNEGKYINSNWYPRVIGHAFNKLPQIQEGDRIIITQAKFAMEPYTDKEGKNKYAFRLTILDFNTVGNPSEAGDAPFDEDDPLG